MLYASVGALMEALAAIESQIARLDDQLKELARRSSVGWRLMSVPGVGPITALAFMAAIEDVGRFGRMRDIGVYLGLTPKRYQSGETDVGLGISHQGDAMARHYLYEAANVLLTTVRKPSALKSWGLKILKRRGRNGRVWRWHASLPCCSAASGRTARTLLLRRRKRKKEVYRERKKAYGEIVATNLASD
jgi:transposase